MHASAESAAYHSLNMQLLAPVPQVPTQESVPLLPAAVVNAFEVQLAPVPAVQVSVVAGSLAVLPLAATSKFAQVYAWLPYVAALL